MSFSIDVKGCNSDTDTLDTTIEEWQKEMEQLTPRNTSGKTLLELCEGLKVCRTTMQNRLQDLINCGKCTWADGTRTDKKGRTYSVTVYQLRKEKK